MDRQTDRQTDGFSSLYSRLSYCIRTEFNHMAS